MSVTAWLVQEVEHGADSARYEGPGNRDIAQAPAARRQVQQAPEVSRPGRLSDAESPQTAAERRLDDRLVDLKTVVACLGVCARTVHRLVAAGELPPPAKVGRASRWFMSDVDGYLANLRRNRGQAYARQQHMREAVQS